MKKAQRKPFRFSDAEIERMKQIVLALQTTTTQETESADVANDMMVCVLGNFLAHNIISLSDCDEDNNELFYLYSIIGWTKNVLRKNGIDIDRQFGKMTASGAEVSKQTPN